ncbi:MAG: hypothetical protein LBH12_03500 [Dysgonamonadaceae bacterium]|jgi:hypothetical protein|nr:hypothetical protein [Dysgonamonadaceae bacterium]
MKKITLFLMGLILSLGYMNAQGSPEYPKFSTNDDGPWYTLQVVAPTDPGRNGRVMTAEGTAVFGRANNPTTLEALNARLWRVEENADGELVLINKLEGKKLSASSRPEGNETLQLTILADNPTTTWTLEEKVGEGYRILANANDLSAQPYVHQANTYADRDYVIMRTDKGWATSFDFVEYVDKGLVVTTDPSPAAFNHVLINDEAGDDNYSLVTVSVFASPSLTGDISYSVSNNEDNSVVVQEGGDWNPSSGGSLELYFYPQEAKNYTFTLSISCADKTVTVDIAGVGVAKVPVQLDAWYRIQFDKRSRFFLTDQGADKEVIATPYDKNNDGQLWKFAATAEPGKFTLVSKSGNGIKYREEVKVGDEITVTGRFLADNGVNTNTYTFELRKDGDWQILWNEYEGIDDDEQPYNGTNINKLNEGSEFTAYKYNPDGGNSVKFFPENTPVDLGLPEFSTVSNPVWYYIKFYRTATSTNEENQRKRFKSEGLGERVTQTVFDEENKESFYWRFEGTWDDFRIVDNAGNFFGVIGTPGDTMALTAANTVSYAFKTFKDTQDWQAQEKSSGKYLNDHGQREVGGYTADDAGARLVITKVSAEQGLINPGQVEDEIVVAVVYYTIQGIQLNGVPTQPGLYIKKDIYASGRVKAKTLLLKN